MTRRPTLVSDKQQKKIVAAYQKGVKLRAIEEEFGVTRSQIYWVLQQQKVAPQRTKPKSRLDDGNDQTLVRLYEVLEAQDQRIQELETILAANGLLEE